MASTPVHRKYLLGILLVLLATIGWSLAGVFGRFLPGLTGGQILGGQINIAAKALKLFPKSGFLSNWIFALTMAGLVTDAGPAAGGSAGPGGEHQRPPAPDGTGLTADRQEPRTVNVCRLRACKVQKLKPARMRRLL